MRRRMGGEYAPPATPRKSVLINVTCGDLLEAVQKMRGEEKGRRGKRE